MKISFEFEGEKWRMYREETSGHFPITGKEALDILEAFSELGEDD